MENSSNINIQNQQKYSHLCSVHQFKSWKLLTLEMLSPKVIYNKSIYWFTSEPSANLKKENLWFYLRMLVKSPSFFIHSEQQLIGTFYMLPWRIITHKLFIEPRLQGLNAPAVKAPSPSHWITREFSTHNLLNCVYFSLYM